MPYIEIKNKVYSITYNVSPGGIFVETFSIENAFRKRGYSRRIFRNLKNKYQKSIVLQCCPTLLKFYQKLGFEIVTSTYDGYLELILQ